MSSPFVLFSLLIFPGLLFLAFFGMALEFVDRKLYARWQNRIGPPWFQPFADFIKLCAKEDLIPASANRLMFRLMPIFAMAAIVTAFLHMPLWNLRPMLAMDGSLIVVIYLLTIPTLTFFLAGWYSTSLYSTIGAVRNLTQLFAYEVPLLLAVLAPAILARSWSLAEIADFYCRHPHYTLGNIIGLAVALVSLQGKLERVPFDIPEAETEIVAGAFTEYSGRLLALFRLALDMEMAVCCSLLAAVFLPYGLQLGGVLGMLLYVIKVLALVAILALVRTLMARLRIEQMVDFCWRYLAPAAFLQIVISLLLDGYLRP